MEKIGIAIAGCGTIGGGTALLLTRDFEEIQKRCGVHLHLKYILDINFTHAEKLGLDPKLFIQDPQKIFSDPDISVFVELIGGVTIAKTMIEKALQSGKHVVTANKSLLALHGPQLFALARQCGKTICFEASCAGGIPIIRAITQGLCANRIHALYGIINGTCNYILTRMCGDGLDYASALQEAQAQGFAEADPTLDVNGMDSAHKLTVLSSLIFGRQVSLKDIPVEGIDTLQIFDIRTGMELGYTIKLLAIAEQKEKGAVLRVRPVFISKKHPLSWVNGSFNAVSIYGHAVGHTMYYGKGAGAMPTASAVVSDIIALAEGTAVRHFETSGVWPDKNLPAVQLPKEEICGRYYIRLTVLDEPGVLAQTASIFGSHHISISSVLQKEQPDAAGAVPVIITTYHVNEGNLIQALQEIDRLPVVKNKSICISIIDEPKE